MILLHSSGLGLAALLPLLAPSQDGLPPVQVPGLEGMDPELVAKIEETVALVLASPTDGAVHAQLGMVYEANTLFPSAVKSYERAVTLLPDRPEWVYRLAVVQLAAGRPVLALENMRLAASKLKNTAVIQARLGAMLLGIGEIDEAEAAWSQAIASEAVQAAPVAWPQSRVGLAQVRMQQERFEEALALLEEALTPYPSYRHAHYLSGLCLLELGEDERGELELRRGVNAWPEYPPDPHQPQLSELAVGFMTRMRNAEGLLMAGRPQDAMGALQEILAARPDDFLALNMLAKAQAMSELFTIAAETYRRSDSIKSDHYVTKIELAIALMNSIGQETSQEQAQAWLEEALQKMREAVALAPRVGRAHFYLGVVLQRSAGSDPQALGGALAEMSLALSLGCQDPMLFQSLAQLSAQTGRTREMLAFAKVHAERNPDDSPAHVFLAQASLKLDLRDEALAAIAHAQAIAPGDPKVLQLVEMFRAEIAKRNAADDAPVSDPDKR